MRNSVTTNTSIRSSEDHINPDSSDCQCSSFYCLWNYKNVFLRVGSSDLILRGGSAALLKDLGTLCVKHKGIFIKKLCSTEHRPLKPETSPLFFFVPLNKPQFIFTGPTQSSSGVKSAPHRCQILSTLLSLFCTFWILSSFNPGELPFIINQSSFRFCCSGSRGFRISLQIGFQQLRCFTLSFLKPEQDDGRH